VENVPLLPSDTHAPSGGPNLETLATQLSQDGLEEIWSPYSHYNYYVTLLFVHFNAKGSFFPLIAPRSQWDWDRGAGHGFDIHEPEGEVP